VDIQDFIGTVSNALLALAASVIVALLFRLRDKANAWLNARTTAAERELLHKTAAEGFAYAETVFRDSGGVEKLTEAQAYLDRRLRELGLTFSVAEVRAAIEKAVLEHNRQVKAVELAPAESVTIQP
jgi:hypothetical protein